MGQNENNALSAIMEYIGYAKKNWFCFRVPNQAVYDAKNQCFRRPPKYCVKGLSDIICIEKLSGKLIAIEVKTEKSYPTKEQKEFLAKIKAFGGKAIVARTTDDIK